MQLSIFSVLLVAICAILVDAGFAAAAVSSSKAALGVIGEAASHIASSPRLLLQPRKVKLQGKCCAVWSSWQDECLEITNNKQLQCTNTGGNMEDINDPPKGEYAIPEDCAVWRIQKKTCLEKAAGYPGKYWSGDEEVVDG